MARFLFSHLKGNYPMYDVVSELLQRLEPDLRELFEERAGIVQWEGGLPQEEAESYALLDVLRRHPWALTGVTVVRFEIGTDTCWLLMTASDGAGRVASLGGRAEYVDDPAEVIEERFQGAALLCKWPERER
jgi:hypothetical protein